MSLGPTLYQESRVSSSSSSPSAILHLNTTPEAAASAFGAGRKRAFDEISGLDEETYARKYLATDGSVFFRRRQRAPRAFLWRVLDDRKVLEIQSVDPVHDKKSERSQSTLNFRVQLAAGIVKSGVAFADPEDSDALEAFVLTTANDLYTVTLKRDLLTRDTAPSEFDAATCLKKHTSSSLAFRHPYKLIAVSNLDLLISLHDGGILRLTRQPNESGAQWRETFYSEGNWSDTIRGLISLKRHHTIIYGDVELEPSAMAAMAMSPDGKYIWAVSLDHQLKAWSTITGKPIAHIDLLNQRLDDEHRKQPKYVMSATQGTLMQLVTLPASSKRHVGAYFLVVRSPKDNQFKFYEVCTPLGDGEGEEQIRLEDLQPTATLIPPIDGMMDSSMWHLDDFSILPGAGWQDSQIWIRARNGKLCRTFTLTFTLLNKRGDAADIEGQWSTGWTAVDPGMQTSEALANCIDFPAGLELALHHSTTPTEKWLGFIFHPGRFSTASIETALNIYRKGRGLASTSKQLKGLQTLEASLQQRLAQAVASKIVTKRLHDGQVDYDAYQSSIQAEWITFYSLLRDLHTRRHESIGLALDPDEGLAWSICADFSAPIRVSSLFEALDANEHLLEGDTLQSLDEHIANTIFPSDEHVQASHIMAAAKGFSFRLPAAFKDKLVSDILSGSLEHIPGDKEQGVQRMQELYDTHDFSAQVMDDDYQALEVAAQSFGGLGDLDDGAIIGVAEGMKEDVDETGTAANRVLNRYGDQLTLTVAQETLERNRHVFLDLLTLVIFMYGDLDQADLHPDFIAHIGQIYDALISRLKHYEMLSWLAKNVIAERDHPRRDAKQSQTSKEDVQVLTLLERIFIGDWEPKSQASESAPLQLTKWSKQWVYGADLWHNWDGVTGHILAFLIKQQRLDLAAEFQGFLLQHEDSSSWLRYLEGRLLISTGEYAEASLKFRIAAQGMAQIQEIAMVDTAHLLSAEEQHYFGDGESRFYQHVSTVYEKLKIFSYAADFAAAALEYLESGEDAGALGSSLAEIDRRKEAANDSPLHQRTDDFLTEIDLLKRYERRKEEIRIRLFTALVETGRYAQALDALTGIAERPIRNANLATLIKACIERDAVPTLLAMPFDAAGDLKQEADKILLGLAKKSLASASSSAIPYHQILYSFRSQRSDFRGAAEILFVYLQRLKHTQAKHGIVDPEEQGLLQAYVLLINTLVCCGEGNAWLLADASVEKVGRGVKKRRLVTIAEVRKEYADELDRRSDLLHGRFALVEDGEGMDVL